MRIEKTMWRILRSIVSSHNRIKRREMVRSAADESYVGKVYATVNSVTSNTTLRNYVIIETSVLGRAPSTITRLVSESVRKTAPLMMEEAQINKGSNNIKSLTSERVHFSLGIDSENTLVNKTVMNILYIHSEEV